MTEQHPITPPPELMKEWIDAWYNAKVKHDNMTEFVAIQAARWGADQELEACCEYLTRCAAWEPEDVQDMLDLRRPKPPSLKEQGLAALQAIEANIPQSLQVFENSCEDIRRALEALPDAD